MQFEGEDNSFPFFPQQQLNTHQQLQMPHATNQLLEQLIEAINEAQTQDRQRFTSAISEVELNRRRDNAQLSNAFATFATRTEDELERTKQGVARLLSHTQPDDAIQSESRNTNNLN